MDADFLIGWQEWVSLPDLGVPAIKAKVDTGARTSALHAFLIEPFGPAHAPMVRFGVHPIPGRLDVAIMCEVPVIDRRDVTSSNGETEQRIFIRTMAALGERTWPIEIGLTNREGMAYRMLLGRTALRDDIRVDASASFRQPRLSYKSYRSAAVAIPMLRPLRIAILTSQGHLPFNRKLASVAAERGHSIEMLDPKDLSLTFSETQTQVLRAGAPLPEFDVVVPRMRRRDAQLTAAVLRHLQASGTIAFNGHEAILRAADKTAMAQYLINDRIAQSVVIGSTVDAETRAPAQRLDVLVVDGAGIAMLDMRGDRVRNASLTRSRGARRLAEHAADAAGLKLAGIAIDTASGHPVVAAVTANPRLAAFAKVSGEDIATQLLDAVEASVPATAAQASWRRGR